MHELTACAAVLGARVTKAKKHTNLKDKTDLFEEMGLSFGQLNKPGKDAFEDEEEVETEV